MNMMQPSVRKMPFQESLENRATLGTLVNRQRRQEWPLDSQGTRESREPFLVLRQMEPRRIILDGEVDHLEDQPRFRVSWKREDGVDRRAVPRLTF